MKKNLIIGVIAALIVVSGASFYGGTRYAGAGAQERASFAPGGGMPRGQFMGGGMRDGLSGFVTGEILAKDAGSVTLKLQDGSSRIVLVATSTSVTKSAPGSIADLATGERVLVTGTPNQDGSLSARTIQTDLPVPEQRPQ